MSIETNMRSAVDVDVVEAGHWAPPESPLDMPAQVLERRAAAPMAGRGLSRLIQAFLPRQRV